uniref:Orf242 n=1 Tax=Tolypocladium ophioglossoides TaxID=71617 RepID=A0A1C9U8C4_9HYPO|nr:orf242 [Tolypocladium ophioglossoides]AOR52827.1 orf242 [Tolypocladium ophioglossoides]
MMNLNYLNFYIVVPSTLFFYCLFQGYFSIQNIKNLLRSYPLIGTVLNILVSVLLICLLLYLFTDTVYAMAPDGSDLPKPEVKLTTGDVSNSIQIKDSNINIPNVVATGLTNLGAGAAIAAGLKGGASIAKATGLSPGAKLGVMAAGAIIGGTTVTTVNAIGSLYQKNVDNAVTSAPKSNLTTPPTSNPGSDNGGPAFSIEPSADLDTVMSLLSANHILHVCILYLPIALMILYISTMIFENKWNLIFIKNIFGEWFYNLFIKSLSYTGKYNRIWMFIGWVFLVFASLVTLYISYFLLNNIDTISEIVQKGK